VNPLELAALAKREARRLGFEACGITDPAASPESGWALDDWLRRGRHGDMTYMERQAAARRDPQAAWPEARTAVVVLHGYYRRETALLRGGGRVARYALGEDYHRVLREKLRTLGRVLVAAAGAGRTRSYADAGPMPERELARRAGLGWFAKNTMLIHPSIGSFTFIGILLTDLVLAKDQPFEADRCGTCRRCLDACPTSAFPAPGVLDSTRCISYLTIEARGEVPDPLRPLVGDWLFGCDVCQEVCPWNVRFAEETREDRYRSRAEEWPALEEIAELDEAGFDRAFADTALERAGRSGLARNARVVLENGRLVATAGRPEA
jgi:epoxyqueuosine reductase